MTVASLGSSWTTTAGAKTVTATPTAGDLIVIICANSGRTTAQAPTITDNNADGFGTYSQVKNATGNTSADSVWIFIRDQLVQSATSTVFTMTPVATDTGGGLNVIRVTGLSKAGTEAWRASGSQNNQAAGTPSITLDTAPLTANAMVGAVLTASNSTTNSAPPTSWSEGIDLGYNSPTTGLETVFRDTGHTSTTVAWTAATPSVFCSVAVEIERSAPVERVAVAGSGYYGGNGYG